MISFPVGESTAPGYLALPQCGEGPGTVGKQATFCTYLGTTHGFFAANRPDAYDATATALAWERTVAFLNAALQP